MSLRRLVRGSLIVISPAVAIVLSLGLDVALLMTGRGAPTEIMLAALLFNGASILQASVGAVIEVRRPGHRIGRLLLVTGPLYAVVAALWLTASDLEAMLSAPWVMMLTSIGAPLSYIAVALFVAGVPLLFPSGSLPGPKWRIPFAILVGLFVAGLAAGFTRPGLIAQTTQVNPFGIPGWPPALQVLEDLVPAALVGLIGLGLAGQVVRYRRGTRIERLQVRWLAAAVAVTLVGFVGVFVEQAIRTDPGPLAAGIVAYVGILLMPIAIGIAVLRYRLYEIDRLISRTISYGLVTATLAVVFIGAVLGLQAMLAQFTGGNTVAVAASTLIVAALFQPLRRRIQSAVDRRFDRARYDGERTVAAFAARLRDQVNLQNLEAELGEVVRRTVAPATLSLWIEQSEAHE